MDDEVARGVGCEVGVQRRAPRLFDAVARPEHLPWTRRRTWPREEGGREEEEEDDDDEDEDEDEDDDDDEEEDDEDDEDEEDDDDAATASTCGIGELPSGAVSGTASKRPSALTSPLNDGCTADGELPAVTVSWKEQ